MLDAFCEAQNFGRMLRDQGRRIHAGCPRSVIRRGVGRPMIARRLPGAQGVARHARPAAPSMRARQAALRAATSTNACAGAARQADGIHQAQRGGAVIDVRSRSRRPARACQRRSAARAAVLGTGLVGSVAVLALEWLDLRAPSTSGRCAGAARHVAGGAAPRGGRSFWLASRQYDRIDATTECLVG